MTPPAPDPPPGDALSGRLLGGHYLLGERLGAGSMGVVYRARHTLLHRDFAVKVLAPALAQDPEVRRRFLLEAEGLVRITHPNVVPVRHFGEEAGIPFLVMDLLEGETLRDLLLREGALPERRAAGIALQVLQGLDAAHWEGVVHRDLKPANVVVSPAGERGGGERVRVLDFGLARVAGTQAIPGSKASAPGTVVGTVAYMSPEQIRGDPKVDGRSDLFTLGAVLHEMVGGRPPFEGPSTLTVAMKILDQPPAPLPEEGPRAVSAPLRAVLARALEKDPGRRFQTAGEMADALREALAGTGPAAAEAAPAATRRRGAVLASAVIAAVALGALATKHFLAPDRADSVPAARAYDDAGAAADRDLARRSLLDARFEAAAAAAGRVIAAGRGTGEDFLLRGQALAGLGDGAAMEDLVRAGSLLGSDSRPALERALFLLDERLDFEASKRELDPVLARGPDPEALALDAWWRLRRAGALRDGGAPAAEADALVAGFPAIEEALGEDPRRCVVESFEAEARLDVDRARDLAERAAAKDPDLADAAYQLGRVCNVLGYRARLPEEIDVARRWHEASVRAAADAVARARRRPEYRLQGRWLVRYWRESCNCRYALGDMEGAAADYVNEIAARNPNCRRDLGWCGQYLQWAGRYEEALRSYAGARRAGEKEGYLHGESFCHLQLGRIKAEAGDLPGALRELDAAVAGFTRGVGHSPSDATFRAYRGETWVTRARLQRDEGAAAALARAREDFDALVASGAASHPEILFRLWEYHEVSGDGAAALEDMRRATTFGRNVTPAYYRRLAYSCILAAEKAADPGPLLEEAVRAADAAERWSPQRAELSCLMRGEARIRAARAAADPAAKSAALAAAREDFARAVSLASLDPRVQAEARLRASRAALAGGDAPTAVRDAEEALRLREAANRDARSSLFVNDYYLRSPLAEYHARLAEAYAAAGRTSDAERERGKAAALR